ncbi:protein kintoun [Epargyreus clarus]|uniref:protein kintoun n=1 Tax=Epargyreus clarus TaxID=520877 RepID=UPI003C2E8323
MATGVKPRDEDSQLTRSDLEAIKDAMKNKKFREMLSDYCKEVRDPANQAIYQKEMTQLEKERGYDITFINPKGCYVIKTSVAGDRKAFINICSNENVGKPSCSVQEVNGQRGMNWQLPYSIIPPREDYDSKKERSVVYDVVFHPDTLRMTQANQQFREMVNKTAFDGLKKTYNIELDSNNCRFPKAEYKGMAVPAVIRKVDPNFKPNDKEAEDSPDVMEKLYPQHIYNQKTEDTNQQKQSEPKSQQKCKTKSKQFTHSNVNGYTVPKYVIKQQKAVDMQDYTYHKDSKQYTAIPSTIIVEINLPLLSSTQDCVLDVREKSLDLVSEKPAKYKLNITLPYSVDEESGNAKFDKTKHTLIVTLPVVKKNFANESINTLRLDSGVESEENSGSQSDEEPGENIVELSSSEVVPPSPDLQSKAPSEEFLLPSIGYTLPTYTHNVLDDIVAFTFHVKNTEPDSVKVKNDGNKVYIKFTSLGSGFVPVHYAALLVFNDNISFSSTSGEAWDNNVILQLEVAGELPQSFQIGLAETDMKEESFEIPQDVKSLKEDYKDNQATVETSPIVEVTNLGTETNIVVSSNSNKYDDEFSEEPDIVWTENSTDNGAKSILRKPLTMMRSFSESSVGDVASSMDYISSDCIPEESSLKKTVRFNDVIARQFYRYNSSIEGQKKKNQRKKSKKRNQERRKSESEAEDDNMSQDKTSKPRLKSVLKQRRDSGLADTSDAENDCKNIPSDASSYNSTDYTDENANGRYDSGSESQETVDNNGNTRGNSQNIPIASKPMKKSKKVEPITCDSIKHNTDLYNPEKLNKGLYLEVAFKNDLIFDLDM